MWNLIQTFFEDMLTSLIEDYLTAFEEMVGNLFRSAFMIETLPGIDSTILSSTVIQNIVYVLYGFMVLLLALKLIWKGFKVYILWRDGESETPPGEMVIGAVFGMVIAIAFPQLYEMAVTVVMEISESVLSLLGYGGLYTDGGNWFETVINTFTGNAASGTAIVLLSIVYIIILLILVCKLLLQSAELLIWRLGVPIAVVGLVDSDGGAWKPYIQMLFKELVTLLVQYFCIVLGTRLIAGLNITSLCLGIAFEIVAFAAPKLLSQFMVPSGGGGGMTQKLYTVSMVVRAFGG